MKETQKGRSMEHYINGAQIFFEEYGSGKPILCLHGFPEDHTVMLGCVEPIFRHKTGYRRIYLDLPGMGKSSVMPTVRNADDILEVLKKFIDQVIGDENFMIIGQSYGAYLSLGLLSQLQEKIDGVFLLCPCVVADKSSRKLPEKQVIYSDPNLINKNKHNADFQDFLEYAVVVTEEVWERYKKEVLPGLQLANSVFIEKYQKQGYSLSQPEFENIQYEKPASIITGRQDNCVGFLDALALTSNFTRATFAVVDSTGHNLQLERPNLFDMYLEDWISRVDLCF